MQFLQATLVIFAKKKLGKNRAIYI